MKNLKRIFVLLFALVLVAPSSVLAKGNNKKDAAEEYNKYNTTNLVETLEAESIELQNKDYTENDKQATIYMFRGQGCGHCQEFLTFLSGITKEYGDKFKLVAFETWQDEANNKLMGEMGDLLGTKATGVPFIVIGDQVFTGYANTYDQQIITAITNLYDTPVEKRYDIFTVEEKDHSTLILIVTLLFAGVFMTTSYNTRKNNK